MLGFQRYVSHKNGSQDATQLHTNDMLNAPWNYYTQDNLPIAYGFMDSTETLRQRLSSHLTPGTSPPEKSSHVNDSDTQISTWSSSSRAPSSTWPELSELGIENALADRDQSPSLRLRRSPTSGSTSTLTYTSHSIPTEEQGTRHSVPDTQRHPNDRPAPNHTDSSGSISMFSDISSSGNNSHFGPGIRAKLNTVLPALLNTISLDEHRTVLIAEYGCMSSRAMSLVRSIIETFMDRIMARIASSPNSSSAMAYRASMAGFARETADLVNFVVIHEDDTNHDFKPFRFALESHPDSYLNPLWQSSFVPSLQNVIYSTFSARPFGSRVVPPDSLHLGFNLMDLHWIHTPNTNVSLPSVAHAELTMCLNARAREFRRGGIFIMAFIARSESGSPAPTETDNLSTSTPSRSKSGSLLFAEQSKRFSTASISEQDAQSTTTPPVPPSTNDKDIWLAMSNMIMPCLQRLVSCGMMKVDVARLMLSLPIHPRTPAQTLRVLEKFSDVWSVEWSCGIGCNKTKEYVTETGETITLTSEPDMLRLPQPAWVAVQSGKLSQDAYYEHIIAMFKNLYEAHFRTVLRERGKLNKGAVEFILDSLWDVLRSRMGDSATCPLADCELEIKILALRRLLKKKKKTSVYLRNGVAFLYTTMYQLVIYCCISMLECTFFGLASPSPAQCLPPLLYVHLHSPARSPRNGAAFPWTQRKL